MANITEVVLNGTHYSLTGGSGTGWSSVEIALLNSWGKTLAYEDSSTGQQLFSNLISLLEDEGSGGDESTSYTSSLDGSVLTLILNGDETILSPSVSNYVLTAIVL